MRDQLSVRLASILFKLNQGDKLDPHQLAEEFSVDVRTIQRDLNVRLSTLPIQKEHGRYQLEPSYLGRLDTHGLQSFAILAGVKGLFPRLDARFIKQLIQEKHQPIIQVQGQSYEAFGEILTHTFEALDKAIVGHRTINFHYQKRDASVKHYTDVEPYRLVNNDGLWYLVAVDTGNAKSFAIGRIKMLSVNNFIFTPDARIYEQLDTDDSVWLGDKKTVTVEVTGKAIQYFKCRALLPQQQLLSETDDTLTLSTQIRHQDQLLPIVQYWIPFVRIIEPQEMLDALGLQLNDYLKNF